MEALALTLPVILKSSVLRVRGEEELAVELPPKRLKSMSEPLAPPPRVVLSEPKKSRSRSTRRRPADPAMEPLSLFLRLVISLSLDGEEMNEK